VTLGIRRIFLALGGLLSATLYFGDGLAGKELGAHEGLFAFYVACSLIQVAASAGLAFSRSLVGAMIFLVVFAFVAAFDVFMLQPVQSISDYLGIGVFILALEMMVVAWRAGGKRNAS